MSRDINDLSPAFRVMAAAFLDNVKSAGIDLIVTCTYRTMAEQTALYAQGRTLPGPIVTRAKAGQSAHNYGMAIDVVPIVNGKCCWNEKDLVWQEIGNIGQAHKLVWYGAPNAKFHEMPHFQHPDWKLP